MARKKTLRLNHVVEALTSKDKKKDSREREEIKRALEEERYSIRRVSDG